MSIFKETFKDFVFKQLRIREAIVEQGNAINDPTNFSSRFGSPREKIILKGGLEENVTIAKGAFYTNSVSKQCVIRMTSGVDITSTKVLETGEKIGSELAKQYILEGGTLDEGKKSRDGKFGEKGGAYGDPFIRSDAKDGFGIVPMPGIIDVNIRTKSAYGSLREAKVNFVCHNRRQLDALEMLYMRPGMYVLLEWGWSPFIDNFGNIENHTPTISEEFLKPKNKTIDELNDNIRKQKKDTGGNYDGFIGCCKNFEIVARQDGGYDCTTELIAMGEALEGLKARRNREKITVEEEQIEVDSLEFLLEAFLELGEYTGGGAIGNLTNSYSNEEDIEFETQLRADAKVLNQFLKNLNNFGIYGAKEASTDGDDDVNLSELATNLGKLRSEKHIKSGRNFMTVTGGNLHPFFLFRGEQMFDTLVGTENEKNINSKTNKPFKSPDTFVRWDFLCTMFNLFVFPEIKEDKESLVKLVYQQEINSKNEYLNFAPYNIPNNLSLIERLLYIKIKNPKSRAWFNKYSNIDEVIVEDILNTSYNPQICLLPNQVKTTKNINDELQKKLGLDNTSIGLIYLNVNHLKKTYMDMAYSDDKKNQDFNLFDYISKIWEDVNIACCDRHNFILQTELENPNHIRVIDLQVNENNLKTIKRKDLFEFKIQGNKSIVRDFNYNTTIPGALSATIAIAAQAPSSISDLDQVTFANFNKGIKSRFTTIEEKKEDDDIENYNQEQLEKYDKLYENYTENVIQLAFYKSLIEKGKYDSDEGRVDKEGFSRVVSLSKNIESQLNSLLKRNPSTGVPRSSIPKSRSAVVPIKFNAKMDGIGGIIIGNIFIVEKEKLPKGYQDDTVAFVVLGESQNITSGQDWTTEISGQLILLEEPMLPSEEKMISGKEREILLDEANIQTFAGQGSQGTTDIQGGIPGAGSMAEQMLQEKYKINSTTTDEDLLEFFPNAEIENGDAKLE